MKVSKLIHDLKEIEELKKENALLKKECEQHIWVNDELKKDKTKRVKKDMKEIVKCIVDLYWDYDRLSSSGQETLDKLAKLHGVATEEETNG